MLKILKKHKRAATVSLLLLCLTVGMTLAYMTKGSNSLTNQFTPGSVETEIKEDPIKVNNNKIEKKPYIENTGKNDALIRARVTISPSDLVREYNIEIDYNTDKWTQNGDWWYYNDILEAPEDGVESKTEPLFTFVEGDIIDDNGNIIKELEGLEIAVYHESVQTVMIIDGNPIEANTGVYIKNEGNTNNTAIIWDTVSSQKDLLEGGD